MPSRNGLSFGHMELEGGLSGLYRPDNVHLSDIALDIFNLDMLCRIGCCSGGCASLINIEPDVWDVMLDLKY